MGRVLVEHHVVKRRAQDDGLVADVAVAPVSRAADDHHTSLTRGHRHGVDGRDQGAHGVGVVAVVGNHRGAAVVHHVETPWGVVRVVHKAAQATAQRAPIHAHGPGSGHRRHGVVDLKANRAVARQWNALQRNAFDPGAFGGHQHAALDKHHTLALRAVCGHDRVVPVSGKKDHRAGAACRHVGDDGVGCIEHRVAAGRHVLHHHPFEHGQVLHGGDVVQPQVVPAADVGDHGYRAAVEAQAFTQHAAPGDFKHRRVHVRVHQHIARAFRAAAVAAVGLPTVDVDTVGVGHANAPAVGRQQVGNQPRGGGFAVGAGHGDHRNAAVVTRGKQLVDHGHTHRPALAVGRCQVHAQARCSVDLHHAAVLGFQRLQHAFADHVHPADVQAHHLGGGHGAGGQRRVHVVGHVGGGAAGAQVSVVAQKHAAALGRDGIGRHVLRLQPHHGDVVKTDFGQRGGMAFAALGILVDQVHQLAHRVQAVADHLRRVPPRGGHHRIAHHQQAEVATG